MQSTTDVQLLSVDEIADALRISQVSVRRLIQRGDIPSHKIGGSLRVRRSAVHEYIEKATVGSRKAA